MITKAENELLTRVGPGTPMGEVLRRYWIPIVISDEVAEPGSDPVRVRLLGEDLVAFRDRTGRVGLIEEFCPHRGASLYYARVDECGLQCIYHGWRFDAEGTTVETPNESGARLWEGKKLIAAYPTREACGVVWAYLGPPDRMPAFPEYPWNVKQNVHAKKVMLECNYLQSVEGGIDSSHLSWLHRSNLGPNRHDLARQDAAPRLEFQDMPYGMRYGAIRQAGGSDQYVRITPFIMPWYTIVPFPAEQTQAAHAWVPIDDEHNWAFTFNYTFVDDPLPPEKWTHPYDMADRFHKLRTRANRHLQDRQAMREGNWAGIPEIPDQDAGIQETMRTIMDRSKEHLGGADLAVMRARAIMLASIKAVQEGGDPVGVGMDFPAEEIRCVVEVIPADRSWQELGLPEKVATPA